MTMTQEAASDVRDGGGADAAAPTPVVMSYANADVMHILHQQLQQQAVIATVDEDTDEDAAIDEILPPEPPSSASENDDAPTTSEPAAAVEDLSLSKAQPADTEERDNDEGPVQEEPVGTSLASHEAALTKVTTVTTADTSNAGDSNVPETETSVTTEAKGSWAGAISNVMQKLQEKKDELIDGSYALRIAITMCV